MIREKIVCDLCNSEIKPERHLIRSFFEDGRLDLSSDETWFHLILDNRRKDGKTEAKYHIDLCDECKAKLLNVIDPDKKMREFY